MSNRKYSQKSADELNAELAQKGYSPREIPNIADQIGVSTTHLKKILNGTRQCSLPLATSLEHLPALPGSTQLPLPIDDVPTMITPQERIRQYMCACAAEKAAAAEKASLKDDVMEAMKCNLSTKHAYYRGWQLSVVAGPCTWEYPEDLLKRIEELDAVIEAAKKNGTATKKDGKPTLKFETLDGVCLD